MMMPAVRWVASRCAVCGSEGGEALFWLQRPDATGSSAIVRCGVCGLRRLDPRPADAVLSELYPDDYYSYIGRRRSARKQQIWDAMRDVTSGVRIAPLGIGGLIRAVACWRFDINVEFDPRSPPTVVDVGCGYGDLLLYLQSRGCATIGVELDERAANAGRKLSVRIESLPLRDLALRAASIDVVILQHALEHIPDPAGVIAEIARITRPGGELHIAVPNGNAAGLRHEREHWGALSFPQHFWYFDSRSLTRLLHAHSFSVREQRTKTIARRPLAPPARPLATPAQAPRQGGPVLRAPPDDPPNPEDGHADLARTARRHASSRGNATCRIRRLRVPSSASTEAGLRPSVRDAKTDTRARAGAHRPQDVGRSRRFNRGRAGCPEPPQAVRRYDRRLPAPHVMLSSVRGALSVAMHLVSSPP